MHRPRPNLDISKLIILVMDMIDITDVITYMVYGLPCLSSSVCSAVRYNIQAPENGLIQCPSAQRFEELEESCQN